MQWTNQDRANLQIGEYIVGLVDFTVSAVERELSEHGSECQCTPGGDVDWWPGFGYAALIGHTPLNPRRFSTFCPTIHPFQPHTRLVADACDPEGLAHWYVESPTNMPDEPMEGSGESESRSEVSGSE